jgi:hypothetical protein
MGRINMYSVYKVNSLDENEINMFIKSSEGALLNNETKSTIPSFFHSRHSNNPNHYKEQLQKHFQESGLVYKQTKNGEPVYIRKASKNPAYIEDGYLTLEFGLINFYNGSKSFIYEQEFWDAWHNYLKEEGYIGWITLLVEGETTNAYQKGIEMNLFGDDVHYGPIRADGQIVPGFKKIKVTF